MENPKKLLLLALFLCPPALACQTPPTAAQQETPRALDPLRHEWKSPSALAPSANSNTVRPPFQTEVYVPPAPLKQTRPVYPPIAQEKGWEGMTKLLVSVTAEGKIEDIQLSESAGHDVLDQAALAAVKTWQFSPATRNGKRVAGSTPIKIRFLIEDHSGKAP